MGEILRTIFFWGNSNNLPLAKSLAHEEKVQKRRALTRDATVFTGDIEDCDRVVLLSDIHPGYAKRVRAAYEQARIPVEEMAVTDPAGPTPIVDPKPIQRPDDSQLRRLSNRELRELAKSRGVDVSAEHPERATIIAAILAAGQKEITP